MLVVVDVGNTNITLGVYNEDKLIANFRLTTKLQRTSDEFGIALFSFFQTKNINPQDVEDVLISSVVPKIMHSLTNAIRKYFNIEPIIVGPGIKTGISIKTENPKELGADRIVDIAAAYHIYGGPTLVIDFGTATTYDYVNELGEFEFGVTSPGIEICAQALWTQAAKLPEIEIKKPESIVCRNTITSMQGGLVYGYIGQTEYIIKKVKEAVGKDIKVVATGGLGRIIYNETDMIDVYDPDFAFKGMKVIYHKNKSH
jgi:type III pantothenate kinase